MGSKKKIKIKNPKELDVNFRVTFVPKKQLKKAKAKLDREDVFAIQEIEIGKEDFMMVMGRTVMSQ